LGHKRLRAFHPASGTAYQTTNPSIDSSVVTLGRSASTRDRIRSSVFSAPVLKIAALLIGHSKPA